MSQINIKMTDTPDPAPSGRIGFYITPDKEGRLIDSSGNTYAIAGIAGEKGWSPVFGIAVDSDRRVVQLVDWVGGEGTKPSSGQYIGASGLVTDIEDAVNIRGPQGIEGEDGREIELRVDGTNLQARYVGDPTWTTLIDLGTIAVSAETLGGPFLFDTTTTDADPGAGKLRYNNATPASVTFLYVDTNANGGADISNYTKSLKTGDVVYIQDKDTGANWARFRLTANATSATGYYKLAVVYVDGGGALPSNNANLMVWYYLGTQTSQAYPSATHRESNTVLFDGDYVTGINASARTGNILFDFTGAQLGACTVMRHQDASAFTFPAEADLMFDTADISTTVANYFMFSIVKIDSPQIVHVFHAIEGGV